MAKSIKIPINLHKILSLLRKLNIEKFSFLIYYFVLKNILFV